jgi:hypothetical protein
MRFKKLFFQCECGRSPLRIREVGLTTEHELVIRWWCTGCKRHIFVVKSLTDCWSECPTDRGWDDVSEEETNQADAQFLRRLGIQFPKAVDS